MSSLNRNVIAAWTLALCLAVPSFGQLIDPDPTTIDVDIVVKYTTTSSLGQVDNYFLEDTVWDYWVDSGSYGTHEAPPRTVTMELGKEHDFWVDKYNITSLTITAENPAGYTLYIAGHNGSDLVMRNQLTDTVGPQDLKKFKMKLVKNSVPAFALGEASSIKMDDTQSWRVGLGTLLNGDGAGNIRLINFNAIGSTISPAALSYSPASPEVTRVLSGGNLRQVLVPQALADIVTINSTSFEIRFYDWTDVGSFNGTEYTLVGSPTPIVTYTVSKPSTYTVRIRKDAGTTYWETEASQGSSWPFTQTVYDWTENGNASSNCLRRANMTYTYNSGNYTYLYLTEEGRPDTSSSFTTSSTTYKTFFEYSWGRQLTSVKEGADSSGANEIRETQFEYYDTSEGVDGAGNYRQLKKVTRPDGGYTEEIKRGQTSKVIY